MILIQKGFLQKKPGVVLRLCLSLLFVVMMAASTPALAQAGEEPTTPCDPQYMDALEKRAWLEAQREIAQNQNIITKPDSVLEYTCFDKFMGVLSGTKEQSILFSETSCCGGEPTPATLNLALGRTVGVTLEKYINQNFKYEKWPGMLGGKLDGIEYTPSGEIEGGTYECDIMQQVWQRAQCINFQTDGMNEEFFDFPMLAEWDPRTKPYGMCNADEGAYITSDDYQDAYNQALMIAYNGRQENYTLEEENPEDDELYEEDDVKTFFRQILPVGTPMGTGAENVECAPPIPTGITIGGDDAYPDAVCPNPGCHYTGEEAQCCDQDGNCKP